MEREEAELRYVTGHETLKEMARETGVSMKTLERWCKDYSWVKKREHETAKALRGAVATRTNKRARALANALEALEEAEAIGIQMGADMLEDMRDLPREYSDQNGNRFSCALDGNRARAFRDLSEAIKTLTGLRMTVDEILTKAEKEKIAIEKRKLKLAEAAADKERETSNVEVTLGEGVNELFE